MKIKLLFFLFTISLISCRKEEDSVDLILLNTLNINEEYGLQLGSVAMGSDYRYQTFYDFGTNAVVASNEKTIWDLAFSCSDDNLVLLNSAKSGLRVAKTDLDWLDEVNPDDLFFEYDLSDGLPEHLVIGDDYNYVFVINRGLNLLGEPMGFMKFVISSVGDGYEITAANLDNSSEETFTIVKDNSFNYIYLDLVSGPLDIAPPNTEFDILFTHYLYIYDPETEPFPYMVSGCLINKNQVEVAQVFDLEYNNISWSDLSSYDFRNNRDAIGFEWKYFDFDEGYVTDPSMNFVVKTTEGDYYKLHFTSFYNEDFESGYPQFEMQKLQPE